MSNELIENPETGELELQPTDRTRSVVAGKKPQKMKRSWGRKDGYSGKFEYEGSTIYIRLLDDTAWDEIEEIEEALQNESEKLDAEGKAIEENVSLPDNTEENETAEESEGANEAEDFNESRPVKMSAAELKAARKAYRRHSMAIADQMFDFQRSIVERTVMGWKDAPVEYSAESLRAILDNEREMVVEWAGIILEKSRLGVADSKNSRRR
jgi:hypothetical protein